MKPFVTVALRFDGEKIWALDQRQLPQEIWIDVTAPAVLIDAIRSLAIRGAPLIGVAAAVCLGCYRGANFESVAQEIRIARPTAVNLMWAVDRMLATYYNGRDVAAEAQSILIEDQELCEKISSYGADLVQDGMTLLTHCNAGALATAGRGTALGIISKANSQGKKIHVYVDETRPLLQGGRLTTWELKRENIPYTLICDNMAPSLMRSGRIQMAIVGADRIALNGDFANKIGTYGVAVSCAHHGVPLIVAAPFSTIDRRCVDGTHIPVELRSSDEISPLETCWNPAFDVTPVGLVHRFVLDSGIYTGDQLNQFILMNSQ